MMKNLLDRYDVHGSLIQGTRFEMILECLTSGRPAPGAGSVIMANKKTAAQRQRRVDDTRAWRARQKRGAAVYPVEVDGTTFDLLERFAGLNADKTDDKRAVASALDRLWHLAVGALLREANARP